MGLFQKHSNCKGDADKEIHYFYVCAKMLCILMRYNKGITIDGIKYLISQYADDTTFILDGSSESEYIEST